MLKKEPIDSPKKKKVRAQKHKPASVRCKYLWQKIPTEPTHKTK